jgi:hypothetical protein
VGGKKAEEVAGKSEVNQVPAREGEKAAGGKAPYLTDIATTAINISVAASPTARGNQAGPTKKGGSRFRLAIHDSTSVWR